MSKRKIFFIQEDNMEATEAFRTVRTNLAFQNDKEIGRKIMVTSSIPGEGKSTLAGNYGASLAIAGKKVLLIDCDIRRPRAHESFGIKVERGLESVLTENVNPKDVIIKDLIPNFDLLPTKHMRYNVTELFIGDKMKEVISSLENEYNTIILDMPPLAVASDAAILSKYVDGVVVVVAYDQVAKRELEFTKEMLSNAGANIYGFVVTKVDKIRGAPNWTHLGEIHLCKAGRSLYRERPAVFMRQQAMLVELPALSAIPHIHAGLPRC